MSLTKHPYLDLEDLSKFQVLSFHFSEVNDLLNERGAKNVQRENILQCIPVE